MSLCLDLTVGFGSCSWKCCHCLYQPQSKHGGEAHCRLPMVKWAASALFVNHVYMWCTVCRLQNNNQMLEGHNSHTIRKKGEYPNRNLSFWWSFKSIKSVYNAVTKKAHTVTQKMNIFKFYHQFFSSPYWQTNNSNTLICHIHFSYLRADSGKVLKENNSGGIWPTLALDLSFS